MKKENKIYRYVGVAFLLQFITSISSGVILRPLWFVEGNITATMINISNQPLLMHFNIFLDMLTAMGIIFLGAALYMALRKQNEIMALVGFGFYLLEGILLAGSRIVMFTLLETSQNFVATGQPANMQWIGNLVFESMEFAGSILPMLAFSIGAILFYYLLYKSKVIPRALSLWGLIAVIPCLIGTVSHLFGYALPFMIYFPYVPFELVVGIWITIKGLSRQSETH
ncbi:MAG: DUF4386 domain-containing protein [Anaerolineaceae bacterium]|nr:DUF4386 domain-containing protein [Anaerolineaceae bacterium]